MPDTRFFETANGGRVGGGLIALDGIHPTTIGYGILAQEVIRVMEAAQVEFPGSADVDFGKLLQADSLVSNPPDTITPLLTTLLIFKVTGTRQPKTLGTVKVI